MKLDKHESCDIYLIFNNNLTEVVVQVQHESIKFDILDYKEYVIRFCKSDTKLVYLWETPFMKQEKIITFLRVFLQNKRAATSFSSIQISSLFQNIQNMMDKLKKVLVINKLFVSAYSYGYSEQEYKVFRNFILNKSTEFKTIFYHPWDKIQFYPEYFSEDKQEVNTVNIFNEVVFPKKFDVAFENIKYSIPRRVLIRKLLLSAGLARKVGIFRMNYRLVFAAEFYVINKLLWNVNKNFEDFEEFKYDIQTNQKMIKYFLWLLNNKQNSN
eukprot:snap_masked-scaffold_4-processed-gene-4.35-mRNA-1 protein AED:1.00 eAED:1.00 QI:0/0/0/0/1/1/2/0/269